ncbi:flagellar biosynthetic protein FliO [Devosia sp. SL43]|uniref:flagellar biosynthetic protein FliO n=1 Tax=Devosia sp. SL43 TaxID=2806348 RepID=UPI001F021E68|nr:flagellar biosynthetic protein FliO [Devosia sp. SL43]UJW86613.1 flagellar biosynthetic protein FliO [Devosia sp. SL43]
MEIITAPFGGLMNTLFALGAVVVGIILVVWLLKLLTGATGRAVRGRNRRLGVVDTLALDPKRQLLIIRRDNVEHLILTGGPADVVIETGIVVEEEEAAQPSRRPIPVVAGRKPAPAPAQKPAAPAVPVAPVAAVAPPVAVPTPEPAPEPALPGSALEKLRAQGLPTNKRAHLSLRHTGLLRPVSEMEMAVSPENAVTAASQAVDSAKENNAQREIEGVDVVEGTTEANRN